MKTRKCTVEFATGKFCDAPGAEWAPFPICSRHALRLLMTMDAMLDAGQRDTLLKLTVGFEEMDQLRARADRRAAMKPKRPEANPVVYFLLIDGLIKIGFASSLAQRLTTYPPTAQVLATEPGNLEREAQLHRQFNEYLTARREWFTPGPKLRAYIEQLADYRAA